MTEKFKIGREDVLSVLAAAFEPLGFVHALWEGGAAGFGRVDQWSDIDLQLVVADDKVEETFERIENTLLTLSEIELKYRLPEPTWHGHSQCFYRLKDASPFLMIDLAVMKESSKNDRFMESRIHGTPRVIFDKTGAVQDKPVDVDEHMQKIQGRLDTLKTMFDLFWILAPKEIHRGNGIEAIAFYMSYTLRPLVEVLRIKYCPIRFFYFTRYVHYDLPSEVAARLETLYFPKDLEALDAYRQEAEDWFWEVYDAIDLEEVRRKLG
jgi:hypothetical protein